MPDYRPECVSFVSERYYQELKCAANSGQGAGAKTVAENHVVFEKISCLPTTLQF